MYVVFEFPLLEFRGSLYDLVSVTRKDEIRSRGGGGG